MASGGKGNVVPLETHPIARQQGCRLSDVSTSKSGSKRWTGIAMTRLAQAGFCTSRHLLLVIPSVYYFRNAKPPDVRIREWICSKSNQYIRAEIVPAEQIGWGVPTIQRLWFGTTIDDKRRRLRAFLTCMRSDTALMLNPDYVPQHLLIMASVLREKKIHNKELDAVVPELKVRMGEM